PGASPMKSTLAQRLGYGVNKDRLPPPQTVRKGHATFVLSRAQTHPAQDIDLIIEVIEAAAVPAIPDEAEREISLYIIILGEFRADRKGKRPGLSGKLGIQRLFIEIKSERAAGAPYLAAARPPGRRRPP